MFRRMHVCLKGSSGSKTLTYEIHPTPGSQLWAQCLSDSANFSSLKERNRFYNFNSDSEAEISKLLLALAEVTSSLQLHYPNLKFPELDHGDLQDSVNRLHVDFAHSHHVTKIVTEKTVHLWESYNTLLHSIEAVLNNDLLLRQFGLPGARIAFTWHNNHRIEIPESSYRDFRLDFSFGTAYANYPQVGRQFLDIFLAKDDTLADEHIQPMRYFSGDTFLWLGPSFGPEWSRNRLAEFEKWFNKRSERYNRLGYYWGDPKLALGSFPVAQLANAPKNKEDIASFITQLSPFNEVASISVD